MKISTAISTLCAASLILATGCVTTGEGVKSESSTAVATAAASDAAPAPLTVDQIAERRNIERELERDYTAYLKRVSERNVSAAIEYAAPEAREAKQTELWQFIAEYSFDNFEIVEKNVTYGANSVDADVKAILVVYQKNVVAPSKKEYVTKWRRVGDKWQLKP